MEKRLLLAFVLSFAVLFGYQLLFPPVPPPVETAEIAAPAPALAPVPAVPAAEVNAPETAPAAEARADVQADEAEELIVETPLYRAVVSNVGGVLTSFQLAEFVDADGNRIELIDRQSAAETGWPLATSSGDASLDELLNTGKFVVRREGNKLSMEFASQGIVAGKAIEFDPENYRFRYETSLHRNGQPVPHRVVWQGGFGDPSPAVVADASRKNVVYGSDGEFSRINIGSVEGQEVTAAQVGIEDQYFLAMFLLPEAGQTEIGTAEVVTGEGEAAVRLRLAAPAGGNEGIEVYVGPKQESSLRQAAPGLEGVIDYGFFSIITKPLVGALLWIHSYIGNFGWAIVILTCAINLILFPLRLKQQLAMQKMQKLQPQMKTLQDKYKKLKTNDPRRTEVQAEMMNLYKEHGVNPLGGCLPLLLQMPFLFAFWSMLSVSIELRQAPWILWIQDLSSYDPYFIMPILMAASMVVMQKMTPSTLDPMQAKIMMAMPVLLTVMFLKVQSGLMLYWITSNIVGVGQQWFINKNWVRPKQAGAAEARVSRNKAGRNRQ